MKLFDTLHRSSEFMWNNVVSSIKILAKGNFTEDSGFWYNDGSEDVFCVITKTDIYWFKGD